MWNTHLPPIFGLDPYLIYAHRFDIVPQNDPDTSRRETRPEYATGMYVVKRARRSDGSCIGDILSLSQLRAPAPLQPRFPGVAADPRLKAHNSLEYSQEFWLNKYFEKDLYYALTFGAI